MQTAGTQISGRGARFSTKTRLGIGKPVPSRPAGLRIGKCTPAEHSTTCAQPVLFCMNLMSGVVAVEQYDSATWVVEDFVCWRSMSRIQKACCREKNQPKLVNFP